MFGCLPLVSNAERQQRTSDRQAAGTQGVSKKAHVDGEASPDEQLYFMVGLLRL